MESFLSPNTNSILNFRQFDQYRGDVSTPNKNTSTQKDGSKRKIVADLFTPEKRNGFYNIDDMSQPMVDPLTEAIRNIEQRHIFDQHNSIGGGANLHLGTSHRKFKKITPRKSSKKKALDREAISNSFQPITSELNQQLYKLDKH